MPYISFLLQPVIDMKLTYVTEIDDLIKITTRVFQFGNRF